MMLVENLRIYNSGVVRHDSYTAIFLLVFVIKQNKILQRHIAKATQ